MSALITDTNPTPSPSASSDSSPDAVTSAVGPPSSERFLAEAERVRSRAASQVVLSQSRCVDDVLDLLGLTSEPAVRTVLEEFLSEIRRRSAVEGAALVAAVTLAAAASHIESSYEDLVLEP